VTRKPSIIEQAFSNQQPAAKLAEADIAALSSKNKPTDFEEFSKTSEATQFSTESDETSVYQLTNFRLHEGEDPTQVHYLGGTPGKRAASEQPSVTAIGTLVAGAGEARQRVIVNGVSDWKIVELPIETPVGSEDLPSKPETEIQIQIQNKDGVWFVLQTPDSHFSHVFNVTLLRARLCSVVERMLSKDSSTTIKQIVEAISQHGSGSIEEEDKWWLWRLRADRQFVLSYVSKKVPTVRETLFGKALNDILFSNELVALYPVAKVAEQDAHSSSMYAAVMNKYRSGTKREMHNRVEVVAADCEDIEAVRKLTDRCVMVARGKWRGRSGYIVGAGRGCYIVSIDGEECQIKGSHLELQDEDYVSSELEEADTVLIPSGSNGEDGAAGEAVEQPVRRSVRLDPDFDEITGTRLVQKRVIIREGKLSGQIGKVASSGHGFYCVRARGVQVKLRRREFEVIEDDPSDSMLSREEIQNNNQPVELRGVASGSDNALVGKNCVVKLNGSHKGQTGVVVAYTYGIYSLNLHDPPDTKLLLLPEDLEVSTGKIESRRQDPSQPKIEEDSGVNSQSGMRVAITSGKHDGRVGMICTVENGTYSIRFGNSEEVKVKGKEVEILEAPADLPAGYESTPQMVQSDEKPAETIAAGHGKLQVGNHAGTAGKMGRQEDGWCCIELSGALEWARRTDVQTQQDLDQLTVEVEEKPTGRGWKDRQVKVVYGLAAGSVGTVSAVLEDTMLVVHVEGGAELRVLATNVKLVPPEPKPDDPEAHVPLSAGTKWVSILEDAAVDKRWQGSFARVLGNGHGWVYIQVSEEELRVKPISLAGLKGPPPGYTEQEPPCRKRLREAGEDPDAARPSSREQRPKRMKAEKKDEDDEDIGGINMANAADGTLVKIRVGEHMGKTGVILWSGHGWINIKVGNDEVRIRSRDIAPADGPGKPSGGSGKDVADASPTPQSRVSIRVGKHKGQTGRVLSSGHGWLWVQLGKEEVRVRRKDVTTLGK